MKYHVIPETRDGCALPTQPDPLPLEKVGGHIALYLTRFAAQGYFSNCRQERIPLDTLAFRLVPDCGTEQDCQRCEETFVAAAITDYCPKCSANMNRTDMQL